MRCPRDEIRKNTAKLSDIQEAFIKGDVEKMKEYTTLAKYGVDNLDLADKATYEKFINDVWASDDIALKKTAPNILHIADLNDELTKRLKLNNAKMYLSKKQLTHQRKSKKQGYNQALRDDEMLKIPEIINNANKAYFNKKTKNFAIAFKDLQDENKVNLIHINKDELGNYIVTSQKINKKNLNQNNFKEISAGAGVEPATPGHAAKGGETKSALSDLPFTENKASTAKTRINDNEISVKSQEQIQKELDNPKEIFVNDSFTNGTQKTSDWAWLGERGRKIEKGINKFFNASRDKTSTVFNAGAKKAIEKINSWTGSKIPEQWADFLVQPNSPMRKHLDEINSDTQLMNQRLDMNEHYTFSLLEKYPKEQIENVARALDGQIEATALSEAEKPLYEKIRNTIDKNAKRLIELGVLKEENQIKDYLKHYYDHYTREGAQISGAIRSNKLGIDKTHKRKNVSDERAGELGGLRMDAYAIVKTISEQMRQIQKAEQLENLARRFGSDVEIEGWVKSAMRA